MRYEAGLSIDEIWSDNPPVFASTPKPQDVEGEEMITFDSAVTTKDSQKGVAVSKPGEASKPNDSQKTPTATTGPVVEDDTSDFELVADTVDKSSSTPSVEADDAGQDTGDYELDELEAEIARELED